MKSKLPAHLEYLSETADNILKFLTSSDPNDQQKFREMVISAETKYLAPQQNSITGKIYEYTRKRGPNIDNYITNLKRSEQNILAVRLKDFLGIVKEGEWLSGSFNTLIFSALFDYINPSLLKKNNKYVLFKDMKKILELKIPINIVNLQLDQKDLEDHREIADGLLEFLSTTERKTELRIQKILEFVEKNTERGAQLEAWLDMFTKSKTPYDRMSILQMLIENEDDSVQLFKLILFKQIMNEILPEYLQSKKDHVLILKNLFKIMNALLPQYIITLKFSQDNRKARHVEIENGSPINIYRKPRPNMDHVHIFSDVHSAIEKAIKNPDLAIFYLTYNDQSNVSKNNDKWHLFWIDPYGKSHQLSPSQELVCLLRNSKNIAECNPAKMPAIRSQCIQVRNNFLEHIKVRIDPVDEGNYHSTFVLKRHSNNCELFWHDHTGKSRSIDLYQYEILKNWLSTQVNWYESSDVIFKSFLPGIDTRNEYDNSNNIRERLEDCLSGKVNNKELQHIVPGKLTTDQKNVVAHLYASTRPVSALFFAPPPLPPTAFTSTLTNVS